jgi:hypothetical protein
MQGLTLLLLFFVSVAGECCTGMAKNDGFSDCKIPDGKAYTWIPKTCDASNSSICRQFTCTASSTTGSIIDTLIYQDCFVDKTFEIAKNKSSVNGYKCTSDAPRIKFSFLGLWIASALFVRVAHFFRA